MISIATAVLVTLATLVQPVANAPDAKAPAAQPVPGTERPRQPGGPGGPGGGQNGPGGERRQISVEGAMKIMNRALETLENQVSDPAKKDENLALVNEMQRGCVIGKGLALPKDVLQRAGDEAAQAKLKTAYRADMMSMLKKLISLEEALLADQFDQAKSILKDVEVARDRGHEAMGVHDDKASSPFYPK